ncbi:MAG TPA: division/cell wall cluster transcriptional repressor MraZ, partial [Caldithrix sp.]|nr:division/cell wall cluster transcriptional repressor MraZ [Caldithrix sp.]
YAPLDSQGRTMIPEKILNIGKIEKDLLIIGSLTKLEIWNPDIYNKYLTEDNLSLSDLAEQISFTDMFYEKGE